MELTQVETVGSSSSKHEPANINSTLDVRLALPGQPVLVSCNSLQFCTQSVAIQYNLITSLSQETRHVETMMF